MPIDQIAKFSFLFIDTIFSILTYAIIIRVILSWIRTDFGRFGMVVNDITEPIFRVVKLLPHRIGMLDLSPIIALFGLDLVAFIVRNLVNLFFVYL